MEANAGVSRDRQPLSHLQARAVSAQERRSGHPCQIEEVCGAYGMDVLAALESGKEVDDGGPEGGQKQPKARQLSC